MTTCLFLRQRPRWSSFPRWDELTCHLRNANRASRGDTQKFHCLILLLGTSGGSAVSDDSRGPSDVRAGFEFLIENRHHLPAPRESWSVSDGEVHPSL